MTDTNQPRGVFAAALTPMTADLAVDLERVVAHNRWLLDNGCDGVAPLGTTGEANSLSIDERLAILDALADAGITGAQMIAGVGCCAFPDTVTLTKRALANGAGGVLMLPPFYYKAPSEDGLFAAYANIVERIGDPALQIYLYNFPQQVGFELPISLVARLHNAFPDTIVGMKDSSGDPDNLNAVLSAFPGFGYFAGNETLLLANMRSGGVGCISATANVNPNAIDRLFQNWQTDDADSLQSSVNEVRTAVQQFPLVPALKKIISHYAGDPEWNRLRPPLVELAEADGDKLIAELDALGFEMQGIRG